MEKMPVSSFLPLVRGTGQIYKNLDKATKRNFKKAYGYLVRHKNHLTTEFTRARVDSVLNNARLSRFDKKIKAIRIIAQNIIL